MKLSPPKNVTFIISIIVAIVGALLASAVIPGQIQLGVILIFVAFALLAAANLLKGL